MNPNVTFLNQQEYKRSDIHDRFGGNRQRGIAASKNYPLIFIFSGKSGENYGYDDGWQDENTYFYTGEGQNGNQVFKEGNRALRDHVENGKDVHLFEKSEKSGMYTYQGQLICVGYHYFSGPDAQGLQRQMIRFEFQRAEHIVDDDAIDQDTSVTSSDLSELRRLATQAVAIDRTTSTQERKVIVRRRAAAIKKYALVRSNGICEACNDSAPFKTPDGTPFLEVHHLTRLSDGGIDSPENVAAICPNCHRRAHYGSDAVEYNQRLIELTAAKEKQAV
ncbi:HNH endonuclease [Bacillus sp. ISL-77]|uniref:HNH endonuclease n=1 Tax=Bacillus sp. ISL-77 TaxID=2819138 RepID=UPI001BECB374|nr:HNH endonuclease [Bacillus sp. ISL-77]MBT2740557.1 HNH endonuclease [Bacillus sp. ISL-77]